MATRMTREWERRMVCRDCGRTIDVLRKPHDGDIWEGRGDRDLWERQAHRGVALKRRPTGLFTRSQLVGSVPDAVLLDPGTAVAFCHPEKCGRVVTLDLFEVARLCCESTVGKIEV